MRDVLQVAVDAAVRRQRQAYVVRLVAADVGAAPAGTVVGTTSLGDWDLVNERAHIGWTAYGPPWWGGPVNAECKLLLLGHAFDDCGFGRVKLQTDGRNDRSQAAIARLGATREGVLRRHQKRADGTFRDTVVFSVLRDEWPSVRRRPRSPPGLTFRESPGGATERAASLGVRTLRQACRHCEPSASMLNVVDSGQGGGRGCAPDRPLVECAA